ncbi:MAG: Mur ligase family protein [Patescibacteria group bacterium]
METSQKHIHIIGICGVATSALAIAFHKKGWKVTGSDKGFFPPVSTELEKHGIAFYPGWHPENIGKPDIAVIGTASGTNNPETAYVKQYLIPTYSFAEAIGKFFVKEHSIVCSGTWGKTSSSALLSHVLTEAGMDPTYMFGGVSLSHEASAKLTDTPWSVFEGDEYKSSPIDTTPKFFYYKPTHLLLSAVSWDHADLYPTSQSYFDTFRKLVSNVPSTGLIVANKDNAGVQETIAGASRVVLYGKAKENAGAQYTYGNITQSETGLSFTIRYNEIEYAIRSQMIGVFQAENITGCFAMAHQIGIAPEKIVEAIASFKGLKRRLEKRLVGDITIFDDIAHSPEKAKSVLENLRSIYRGKLIAIFEPNIGGREQASAHLYDNAFLGADIIVIPRLTKLKISDNEISRPMEGNELAETIKKTHPHVEYFEEDEKLVAYLKDTAKKGDVIAFLGSHGFRGMIEETITSPRQQSQ